MNCSKIEEQLSEFLESSLPAGEMDKISEHLKTCPNCSALLDEMRSTVSLCRSYPTLEMDLDLVEKILLRTSGRPRTRSFQELVRQYFIRPLLTPRFAVGAGLAALFLVLLVNLVLPRMSLTVAAFSPSELFKIMDRGVQQLYGEGLKAYDKKNEWQAQFTYFKNNAINRLRFMMEQLDVPMEGRKKSEEPVQHKEKGSSQKNSGLRFFPA
jgi:hypothetical protein